jgi:hypothetical protein
MPKNIKDFWSGVLYLLVGGSALYLGQEYPMGTAVRMGPGYFPTILGYLLVLIGGAALLRSFFQEGNPLNGFAVKKIIIITVSILAFGLLVEGAGLAIAVVAVVMISASGSRYFDWKKSLAVALGAALFCSLVFVKGLGVPLPVFGPWLGM